jgi:hypothetical protein
MDEHLKVLLNRLYANWKKAGIFLNTDEFQPWNPSVFEGLYTQWKTGEVSNRDFARSLVNLDRSQEVRRKLIEEEIGSIVDLEIIDSWNLIEAMLLLVAKQPEYKKHALLDYIDGIGQPYYEQGHAEPRGIISTDDILDWLLDLEYQETELPFAE